MSRTATILNVSTGRRRRVCLWNLGLVLLSWTVSGLSSVTTTRRRTAITSSAPVSQWKDSTETSSWSISPKRGEAHHNLHFSTRRVSREQEIELARIIQRGATIENLRREAAQQGKTLSKQEWADLAGISTKDLRKQVSNYRKAKQELVTANMGLVHSVVNQQWPYYQKKGVSRQELVQEGSLGLLRAAELFDPDKGIRFSTYAVVWIKGQLSHSHVQELVRLPSREKTKYNKLVKAQEQLGSVTGVNPSVEELASMTGFTVSEVLEIQRKMTQARAVMSLDFEYRSHSRSGVEDSSLGMDLLQRDQNLQEDTAGEQTQMLQTDLEEIMARNLDERESRLLQLRYGLTDGAPKSLQQCADILGLSKSRAQQLAQAGLKKLRQAGEASVLEEYLLTLT